MQGQARSSRIVEQLFLNNMCLFCYGPRDKNQKWQDNGNNPEKRLVSEGQSPLKQHPLVLAQRCCRSRAKVFQVERYWGRCRRFVKTLRFLRFVADDESDTEPSEKKRNKQSKWEEIQGWTLYLYFA